MSRRDTPMFLVDGDLQTGADHETSGHRRVGRVNRGMRYQFIVAERLTAETLADFPELAEATSLVGHWGTELFGPVPDRAHLYELLHRFNVLGLTVVEMRMLPD